MLLGEQMARRVSKDLGPSQGPHGSKVAAEFQHCAFMSDSTLHSRTVGMGCLLWHSPRRMSLARMRSIIKGMQTTIAVTGFVSHLLRPLVQAKVAVVWWGVEWR